MMNIEETTKKVDLLLQDRGLTSEYQEQAVRQLLYHLFVAIDIYRYMTVAEKAKAGYWYRIFKGSFSLRNFLKERKRTRERKNPPCTPLIKKDSVEKALKTTATPHTREVLTLKDRREKFWKEIHAYVLDGKYGIEMAERFFLHWAENVKGTDKMLWEIKSSWNLAYRLAKWSKTSYEANDQVASIRLTKAKASKKKETKADEQQVAIARERMMEQERREREFAENKAKAVSREEWLAMKAAQEEQNT